MAALTPDLLKKIRKIQVQAKHLAEDIFAGAYKSAFKGQGLEFEEDREYQEGDDVRHIDWNVTLRMNHPYVKTYREEREITVMLVVDLSRSLHFGSKELLKTELIAEVGAVIAFSAIRNQDKIGLLLFTDEIELYIPPHKGLRHVFRIIRELLAFEPRGKGSNLSGAMAYLGTIIQRRGVCFILSDFLCPDYEKSLAIASKKHDLIAIAIRDPLEEKIPDIGLATFKDLETLEERIVDTSDPEVVSQAASFAEERYKKHKSFMDKTGGGFISLSTDQPYLPPLRNFFRMRGRKRR